VLNTGDVRNDHNLSRKADAEVSRGLIASLNAELSAPYPEPGANHFQLDPEEVAQGRGTFARMLSSWIAATLVPAESCDKSKLCSTDKGAELQFGAVLRSASVSYRCC